MSKLYSSPLRVYLVLGILAVMGIFSGMSLPVSLFPNSFKPIVMADFRLRGMSSDTFLQSHGQDIEENLKSISFQGHSVEDVYANYDSDRVSYTIHFGWGAKPTDARQAVQNVILNFSNRLPKQMQDSVWVWSSNETGGFFATTFYSDQRSPEEVYKILYPILTPELAKLSDAEEKEIWNPQRKEIRIELDPEKIAVYQIFPSDIERALAKSLGERAGGQLSAGDNSFTIRIQREVKDIVELDRVLVKSRSGRSVFLKELAVIEYGPQQFQNNIRKVNNSPSLMVFITPRQGSNIKKLSEDALSAIHSILPRLPSDIKFKVLVDPSEFIRSAVKNVVHEVMLAAFLAVVILFLFIGNLKNVATAAIEIPMSIILAFILMKLTGINMNLISLGGLALSAGMNVDASVVVMENIFRHFEGTANNLNANERLRIVINAVKEVRMPIIASTISSLVVFLPLALTSDLTNALLGDLALAVMYSHGLSAIVAIILVPTVRLHIMNKYGHQGHEKLGIIDKPFKKIEAMYRASLGIFISNTKLKYSVYILSTALLLGLILFGLPRLNKQIIGEPDTDWIAININTSGNTLISQMDELESKIQKRLIDKFGSEIAYTFSRVQRPNYANIMARINNKRKMPELRKKIEEEFVNTPDLFFSIENWNPSELPIPVLPNFKMSVFANDREEARLATQNLIDIFDAKKIYKRIQTKPNTRKNEEVRLTLNKEQWQAISLAGESVTPEDIADLTRAATESIEVGEMSVSNEQSKIRLYFPKDRVKSLEDLSSLPLNIAGRLVPLRALAKIERADKPSEIQKINGQEVITVKGFLKIDDRAKEDQFHAQATQILSDFKKKQVNSNVSFVIDDHKKELTDSLRQLSVAIALSVFLIFLTMVFQFGHPMTALLILVAVPLGIIGVISSLLIFGSSLSLNSALGIILLNGLVVANSIILVDYMYKLVSQGQEPYLAALNACERRLRPILMTTLTTLFGMLPIAIGMGEGGKILQPLGITVAGGLFVSTLLTLFVVPSLQVTFLNWKTKLYRSGKSGSGTKYVFEPALKNTDIVGGHNL